MVRKKQTPKMVWRKKEPPPPPWTELPRDITANILQRLDVKFILEDAQRVCKTWRTVCKDPAMWRKIDMSLHSKYLFDAESMCKHAVDLSQGQLVHIKIGFFATDGLLAYIGERSHQLRYLFLDTCWYELSDDGLIEAIKRFPLLEELHLFHAEVFSEDIETVSRCCPLLKSFTIGAVEHSPDDDVTHLGMESNKEALAIAKTMPELRHLSLVGKSLTNDGLLAILDGCTHLESLDLRGCYRVNLEGDIGKRCQQLKCVRWPKDSFEDLKMYDSDAFKDYISIVSGSDFMDDYDDEYYDDYEDYDDFSMFALWAALDFEDENILSEDILRNL